MLTIIITQNLSFRISFVLLIVLYQTVSGNAVTLFAWERNPIFSSSLFLETVCFFYFMSLPVIRGDLSRITPRDGCLQL